MLTAIQRGNLPAVAAQVAARYPGATLTLNGTDAVLTVGPDVTKARRKAACKLVAQSIDDFRLITPDDPAPATIPDGWAEQHRRGNHHLDLHSASAFR